MLENDHYLGDERYPRVISDEDFLAVQTLRSGKNTYTPCKVDDAIRAKAVCGQCGTKTVRVAKRRKTSLWKCENPDCGYTAYISDDGLVAAVNALLDELAHTPETLAKRIPQGPAPSGSAQCVANELTNALNRGTESVEYLRTLVFACAAEKYSELPDSSLQYKVDKEFNKLIADCKAGKIDLVITKSVSRFGRNTLDCLKYTRELKRRGIGVYFEKENVNTLYMDNEMILTFFFSQAQAESESLSGNVKWGHRKNFKDGKVYYQYKSFMGYRKGPNGEPEIDEAQAAVVRRIFARYLMGDSVSQICKGLEADGIKTVRGNDKWTDGVIRGMLQNEKYIGDALLQKTYIADIFTHQAKKNMGELPKYYVHDCHPAIIDRETFRKVQEEMARRSGKRRTSSKAKTELGKYSGKYAFSELLVCGECGSPYRRQTYMPRGDKYYVWRCLNRMENGTRICKNSPTFKERELQVAVIAAINEMFSQQKAKDAARDSVAAALAEESPKLSLPAIEAQLRAVQDRQMELMRLALNAGVDNTAYDDELQKIYAAKAQLMMLKEEMNHAEQTRTEYDDRMERIDTALELDSGAIEEYDEIMVRQLISNIKVLDAETILVRFKDGTEIRQRIELKKEVGKS